MKKIQCPYVILNGNPEQTEESVYDEDTHVVSLRCPDDYEGLPRKIKAGFRFVKERFDPDFVFKIDDDMFVDLDNLFEAVDGLHCDYAGITSYHDYTGVYFGGPLYYVSRKSIELLQNMDIEYSTAEDVCVGNCLRYTIRRCVQLYTNDSREGKTAIAFHDAKRQFL